MVAFADLGPDPQPPNILETIANAERDNLMQTLKGKVTSETAIQLVNVPGREFQIATLPQGTLMERIYLAKVEGKNRLYILAAAGDTYTPTSAEMTQFFASFWFHGSVLPPTFLDAGAPPGGGQLPPAFNPPRIPILPQRREGRAAP